MTAYGVLMAIEAAVERGAGADGPCGSQGRRAGSRQCRRPLCGYLRERGARLTVADPDPARAARAKDEHGAEVVDQDAIYDQEVDLFAPCALGAVLNDRTIPRLRCRLVCGGANNQLAAATHDDALAARGITFLPDYLANAGGVIDFYQEFDRRPPRGRAGVGGAHSRHHDRRATARGDVGRDAVPGGGPDRAGTAPGCAGKAPRDLTDGYTKSSIRIGSSRMRLPVAW